MRIIKPSHLLQERRHRPGAVLEQRRKLLVSHVALPCLGCIPAGVHRIAVAQPGGAHRSVQQRVGQRVLHGGASPGRSGHLAAGRQLRPQLRHLVPGLGHLRLSKDLCLHLSGAHRLAGGHSLLRFLAFAADEGKLLLQIRPLTPRGLQQHLLRRGLGPLYDDLGVQLVPHLPKLLPQPLARKLLLRVLLLRRGSPAEGHLHLTLLNRQLLAKILAFHLHLVLAL
mmetsp:Transcript_94693/g.225543  ORF Transcript_94693/g.225543 Transcript_94693/m.225543 type:complete len:225 (+) Transcript_94693:366-1040(+)